MKLAEIDPRGLIGEAYRIRGIGAAECRAIFLDWLLKLPAGMNETEAMRLLLRIHAPLAPPGHPMTRLLEEGLAGRVQPRRRGGARRRRDPPGRG